MSAAVQPRPPKPAKANREAGTLVPVPASAKPAAAYLRRSTDRQEQSLQDQRREVLAWAERNGFSIVAEYVDDAISGTSTRTRPGFQRMIADAGRGKFTAVVVWSSDRFSRADLTETEHHRYLLREAGVTVHSVTEEYLARDGIDGEVLRAVRQIQNRQYSIAISQNTLRGQISSVLAASDCGRMPPFGYDRELVGPDGAVLYRLRFREGGDRAVYDRHGVLQSVYAKGQMLRKPGKDCKARLVLSEPRRVKAVRDIFGMCTEGVGFKGIAAELNRRGLPSPRGKLWQHTTVKALLENPVYYGALVWNRRTLSKFYRVRNGRADALRSAVESGKVEFTRPDDWIVIENAAPAIVDRKTWDRAQEAARARSEEEARHGRGKQAGRWLLSGVLKCACCGNPWWGFNKRKGKIPGRREVVTAYYACSGRLSRGKSVCPVPAHIRADALESWVLAQLQPTIIADGESVEHAVRRFVAAARAKRSDREDPEPLRKELARIDRQVKVLVDGLDPANLTLVNDQLTALRHRREGVQAALRALESNAGNLDDKAMAAWARERIGLFQQIVAGRRDEQARQAIASYVERVDVDPRSFTFALRRTPPSRTVEP